MSLLRESRARDRSTRPSPPRSPRPRRTRFATAEQLVQALDPRGSVVGGPPSHGSGGQAGRRPWRPRRRVAVALAPHGAGGSAWYLFAIGDPSELSPRRDRGLDQAAHQPARSRDQPLLVTRWFPHRLRFGGVGQPRRLGAAARRTPEGEPHAGTCRETTGIRHGHPTASGSRSSPTWTEAASIWCPRSVPRPAAFSTPIGGLDFESGLAWSPDGSRLALSIGPGLYLVPARGGEAEQVALPSEIVRWKIIDVSWAPRGDRITFVARAAAGLSTATIWSVRPDGSDAVRVTGGTSFDRNPVWTPDGRGHLLGVGPWREP